ncbi:MBL fold metallo-hydrolase [Rubrivirga sp. S365]|uniref:MBL fold metallo-hydrolase n=1 Tax=Rubrivirga sp. S365 TaxID=3076080 RepID=UPI0028C778E5|nr:MBL fold metallo-hydrolase [Rubrivirga sp. S365]MDT7856117.1 MBL fold metallo-hydrolase [Rubrivirga sp. S365]
MSPLVRRTLVGSALVGGAVAAGAAALRHPVFGAAPEGERLARMRRSPQWRGGRFQNPEGARVGASPGAAWAWLTDRAADRRPGGAVPTVPRRAVSFTAPQDLRVTWLGHSTALLEVEGARLLTDPVWSPTASPGAAFGVRRFFEPPLPLDQVPSLDAVLVTHDHYDHLDWQTVRALVPSVPRWLVPLGVGAHLEAWGVPADRITELDWWEEATVAGLRVVATPARHFSGRTLGDRDRTLWCGWAVLGRDRRVYVTGDGGYQAAFAEVGRRLGPFDATLVEVGAYNALWADIHMGPEQAVRAVQDARGGLMLPVHWGTFDLALHGWTEPVERALVAAGAAGVPTAVPRPGESVFPFAPPPPERWWPDLDWQTAAEAPVVSGGVGR